MGECCNCKDLAKKIYPEKLKILLKNKIALWDVIATCNRDGSLDSNIENEIPNEIPKLLKKYNIKRICFNGNKSYLSFKKYFPQILEQYDCYKLPSTSPANAKYKLEDLYNEWSKAVVIE